MADFINPSQLAVPPTFTHCVVTRSDALVFVSGCVGMDASGNIVSPGDVAGQCRKALENMGACLEAAGSDFPHVLKITNFMIDPSEFYKIAPVRAEFFQKPPPASTLIGVTGLQFPGLLVEIEAIAECVRGAK